jgi:hypothetical protein
MKFHTFIIFLLLLLTNGCWDESQSPTLWNRTGQEIFVHLLYVDKEIIHTLKNESLVLVPDGVLEQGMTEINITNSSGDSLSLSVQDISNYLKNKLNLLVINENFSIEASQENP